MKLSRKSLIHNQSPEYRHALQELIKFELQALVERLSATGEEALVLTASSQDGSTMQFGSQKAERFLQKQISLGQEFLSYCQDDQGASSADEMCPSADDLEQDSAIKDLSGSQQSSRNVAYSPVRQRERTSSKRSSFTEVEVKETLYEVSQNSDLSASERNDSASSVASFAEAEEAVDKTSKSRLQCKICSRMCRSYKTLGQHMRLHMSKTYKCNICGKIFTLKKSYQRHVKSHKPHKDDKQFECVICDKTFSDLNAWKRHKVCHLDVRKYSCNLCGKAFYEKYSLRVHQTSHFYPTLKPEKCTDITSGYSCHICGKLLKTKNAIKNHMLTHSAKKFTCEFCNKRFSLRYSYVRHRHIHTGEKPYKCGVCDKSFSDSSAWSKHIKMHSGHKPYSCAVCSQSFYDKTVCKTHMQKAHKLGKSFKPVEVDSKRNFEMISSDLTTARNNNFKAKANTDDDFEFEISATNADINHDELNLGIDISDKESEDSQLLASHFRETSEFSGKEKSPEKFLESVDDVVLDEKFQTDFVERNMPSKTIESDNELISSAFPEDSDIYEADIDQDLQTSAQEQDLFKDIEHKPSDLQEQKQPENWTRPLNQKRQNKGKGFAESPAKCKICHKKFKQESLLKQHVQFHCMSKLYKCRYCGKQLASKHSLIRHERNHIGDRPYQCNICQKTFADNYGCIRHINSHSKHKASNNTSNRSTRRATASQNSYTKTHDHQLDYTHCSSFYQQELGKVHKSNRPQSVKTESELKPLISTSVSVQGATDRYSTPTAATSNEKPVCTMNQPSAETSIKNTPIDSSVTVATSMTHRFRCFKCSNLFPTEVACIEHIKKGCAKAPTPLVALPAVTTGASSTTISQPLKAVISDPLLSADRMAQQPTATKNIYQCSLCLLMFEDQATCERHLVECSKPRVESECAVESIMQESFVTSELSSHNEFENLPRLPFPELETDSGFLKLSDTQLLLLSRSPSQSTVLNQSSSVIPPTSANAEPVTKALTPPSSSSLAGTLASQGSGSLKFIPFTQIVSQSVSSVTLSPGIQPTVKVQLSDGQYRSHLQKPVVNVGSSNLIISNQGQNFLQQTVQAPVGKVEKKDKKKGGETDIQERTCEICGKVFTTKHILKQHILIHMERKFGCKYCMKKFHHKYGRDRHERIHTGEKPFVCPYCKKAFGDNSMFRKHIRECPDAK